MWWKNLKKIEKILDFFGGVKKLENWVVFWGLKIGKFLGCLWWDYCWVEAGLAGLRIFVFFVFFGVFEFLVVFDIYVWRYKFFLLWVCGELLEEWLIILVFLVLSCWIIGRKCKNFDGNFGPVWSFFEIFAISLKNVLKKKFFSFWNLLKNFRMKILKFSLGFIKIMKFARNFYKVIKNIAKMVEFFSISLKCVEK